MKKKFFVTAAIATLMGVGAYFGHATATPDTESNLLLTNAEAMADDTESTICSFKKVNKDEEKHKVDCSGKGRQCCKLD